MNERTHEERNNIKRRKEASRRYRKSTEKADTHDIQLPRRVGNGTRRQPTETTVSDQSIDGSGEGTGEGREGRSVETTTS